jgi:hypothetical protein
MKKSARFVPSLYSSLEYPRSSGEALPGSGCRPLRWRFSGGFGAMAAVEFSIEALGIAISDGLSPGLLTALAVAAVFRLLPD